MSNYVSKSILPRPEIPLSVYREAKRCSSCHSVFLTDFACEACGKSLLFHPIGEPFSSKSYYGIKERYLLGFHPWVKCYPFFENYQSNSAQSYSRHLLKRFDNLLIAFGNPEAMATEDRKLFYFETLEIIDEMFCYGISPFLVGQKIEEHSMGLGQVLAQELLVYSHKSSQQNQLSKPWPENLLNLRLAGLMRVETVLKVFLFSAAIVTAAVMYFSFFNSLVGK